MGQCKAFNILIGISVTIALHSSVYFGWFIPMLLVGGSVYCLKAFLDLLSTRDKVQTVSNTQNVLGIMRQQIQNDAHESAVRMTEIISSDLQAQNEAALEFCYKEAQISTKSIQLRKSAQQIAHKHEIASAIKQLADEEDAVKVTYLQKLQKDEEASKLQVDRLKAILGQKEERAMKLLQLKKTQNRQKMADMFARTQADIRTARDLQRSSWPCGM